MKDWKINKTKNYVLNKVKRSNLISEKYKKTCSYLNYVKNLFIRFSTVATCISVSTFSSLVWVPVGITRFTVNINIYEITAGIKKYKSIIKRKEKKHHKIVLLEKYKFNTIEVLMSAPLIDSYISHDDFVLANYVLIEYIKMKEGKKYPEDFVEYTK